MKSWANIKKAYNAGGDKYRKSRWSDLILPLTVVPAVTAEVCRRHGFMDSHDNRNVQDKRFAHDDRLALPSR